MAVVVAQLAEQLVPIPEVCGLNPVIGKILQWTYLLLTVEKTSIKKIETGNGPIFLKIIATPVFSDLSVTVWTISVPKFRMLFEGPLGVGSIHSPDL